MFLPDSRVLQSALKWFTPFTTNERTVAPNGSDIFFKQGRSEPNLCIASADGGFVGELLSISPDSLLVLRLNFRSNYSFRILNLNFFAGLRCIRSGDHTFLIGHNRIAAL